MHSDKSFPGAQRREILAMVLARRAGALLPPADKRLLRAALGGRLDVVGCLWLVERAGCVRGRADRRPLLLLREFDEDIALELPPRDADDLARRLRVVPPRRR